VFNTPLQYATELWRKQLLLLPVLVCVALLGFADSALAAYGSVNKTSVVDPNILKIDEMTHLGEKINYDFTLLDETGNNFALGDMLGKPLILALSYYTCDGACSVINRNLKETLEGVDRWQMGKDYNVLTISFDQNDTPDTLSAFIQKTGFTDGLSPGWKMATMRNKEDIIRLTNSVGFKFFWSPRDGLFLHPNVYIMLSPEGRVTRYLYGNTITARDIQLSITKAIGEKISAANIINFVVGACYSYNYKDGKYTVNIPMIIAGGALVFGLGLIAISFLIMKRRVQNETQISNV
jgi:protein SCO1/2